MVRWLLPNGSRLSCGRNARWRKALESQRKETRGRGNAALPYLRAPGSFKRLLGGSDRKSTRLNSSHLVISYAVFCLKKKSDREGGAGRARRYGNAIRNARHGSA